MKLLHCLLLLILTIPVYGSSIDVTKKPYSYNGTDVRTYFGKDSLIGLEDTNGHKLTPAIYTEMGVCRWGNMIIVEKEDSLYGLINTKGEVLLPAIYNFLERDGSNGSFEEVEISVRVRKNKEWKNLYYHENENCFNEKPQRIKPNWKEIIDSLKHYYNEVESIDSITGYCGSSLSETANDPENDVRHKITFSGWCSGAASPKYDIIGFQVKKGNKSYILSKDAKTILTEGIQWDSPQSVYERQRHCNYDYRFVCNKDTLIVIDYKKQKVIYKISAKYKKIRKGKGYYTLTNSKGDSISIMPDMCWIVNKYHPTDYYRRIFTNDKFVCFYDWAYKIKRKERGNKYGIDKCYYLSESDTLLYTKTAIIPRKYDKIDYKEPFFLVEKGDFEGLFSKDGKKIAKCKYLDIEIEPIDSTNNLFIIKRSMLLPRAGVFSSTGANIISQRFGDIEYIKDCKCFCIVKLYGLGLYSLEGKKIIPCRYKEINIVEVNGSIFYVTCTKSNKYKCFSQKGEKISTWNIKKIKKSSKGDYIDIVNKKGLIETIPIKVIGKWTQHFN